MLRKPTIENVRRLLSDGNYVRAASLAKSISNDDPMVIILANELAKIGNKKRSGTGRRSSDVAALVALNGNPVPKGPNNLNETLAVMEFHYLVEARDVVDGRADGDMTESKSLLRNWKLANVPRQQFRTQARSAVANKRKIEETKLSELTRRRRT